MIGVIDVECQAANPNMPLYPMRAFVGSPSSIRVRNVPKRIGDWCIRSVEFTAVYPDGAIKTAECVLTGGVWVGTIEGTSTSGTSKNGYTILASGTDENGNAVTGYILGKGDIEILEADGTLAPDPTRYYVKLLSAEGETPREGDMYPTEGGYVIWQSGQANQLGTPFEEITAYVDSAISSKADLSAIPTATSQLTNDSGFVTSADVPTPSYIEDANGNKIEADLSYSTANWAGWRIVGTDEVLTDGDKWNANNMPSSPQEGDDYYNVIFFEDESAWWLFAYRWNGTTWDSATETGISGTLDVTTLDFSTVKLEQVNKSGTLATSDHLELKQDKLSEDQIFAIDYEVNDLYTHIQTVGGAGNYSFKSPNTFDKSLLIEQGILSSDGTTWIYQPVQVHMGSNVGAINSGAFQNATNLLSFTGKNVGLFQSNVFSGCAALRRVVIPNATIIGTWMFRYCTALKTITMPKSVTTISRNAFADSSFDKVFFEGKTLAEVKAMANYSRWMLAEAKIYTNAFENQLPTKTSELSNDSGFITSADVPTKTSELSNDSGFIEQNGTAVIHNLTCDQLVANQAYIVGYAKSSELPTKTSDLSNDSGFITSNPWTCGWRLTFNGTPTDDSLSARLNGRLIAYTDNKKVCRFDCVLDRSNISELYHFSGMDFQAFITINDLSNLVDGYTKNITGPTLNYTDAWGYYKNEVPTQTEFDFLSVTFNVQE